MRKMKDSGIEWIGEIPEEWDVSRSKNIFRQRTSKGNSVEVLLAATQKAGMIPQNQIEGVVQVKIETDLQQFRTVHINDFVISLRSFQGGFEFSSYEGVCSPAYQVFYNYKNISHKYFRYLFKSDGFIQKMNSLTVGIREGKNIQYNDFANSLIPFPPLPEQQRIADYLDAKCGEIDSAIEKQTLIIEKLREYKRSLITQVVTKGLNPKAKMKNTGIDWIGEIPELWEVRKLKFCSTSPVVKNGDSNTSLKYIALENIVSGNGHYIETNSEYDKSQAILFQSGDILWGKLRPYLAKVFHAKEKGCCSTEFCILRIYNHYSIRFFWNLLISSGFVGTVNQSTYGSKMPRANEDFIRNMFIPLPPLSEQQQIADYLDDKCNKIDAVITQKQVLIEKLTEYKKSLIYEVVTGKRDI